MDRMTGEGSEHLRLALRVDELHVALLQAMANDEIFVDADLDVDQCVADAVDVQTVYAACFSASARSVASQVNSGSSRPKWPYAAVLQ